MARTENSRLMSSLWSEFISVWVLGPGQYHHLEVVRNANSQALPRPLGIRNSEGGVQKFLC